MTELAVGELARLERVTCSYGPDPVLVNVDLSIDADQFTGVVGPSGSGKTTLLRLLLGTVEPLAGTVRRRPGLRVGYVPQVETINWSFPVTVSECVLMARTRGRIRPWRSRAEQAEIDEILERLGIAALSARHIRRLSGGQQQRVFIARAMLGRPHLLLMDEPTSGVDVRTRHEVLHLLEDLHHDGLGGHLDDARSQWHRIAPAPPRVPQHRGHRRRGAPRRPHPRGHGTHLRRPHGDPRTRGDAHRCRGLHAP